MPKLTLFIFSSRDFDPQKTIESVPIDEKAIVLIDERRLDQVKIGTPWVGFLMADEMLDEKLAKALPTYLESEYECLVMFKETYGTDGVKHYHTPRFFRNNVTFGESGLYPLNINDLKCTRVLDGRIIDAG